MFSKASMVRSWSQCFEARFVVIGNDYYYTITNKYYINNTFYFKLDRNSWKHRRKTRIIIYSLY